MKIIKWDQSLSVGNKLIDKQHKKLFDIRNELVEAVANETNYAILAETITKLLEYTKLHFIAEEKLLAERSYPELQAHKKIHKEFLHQIVMFSGEAGSDRISVQLKLIKHLSDWIILHTSKFDLEYKKYM